MRDNWEEAAPDSRASHAYKLSLGPQNVTSVCSYKYDVFNGDDALVKNLCLIIKGKSRFAYAPLTSKHGFGN